MLPNEWISLIDKGIKAKELYGRSKEWDNYLSLYTSEYSGNDILSYNLLYSMCKATIAKLYYSNPQVTITPSMHSFFNNESLKNASIIENIINMLLEDVLDVKNQSKLAIQDCILYGIGIYKIGYDSEYGVRTSLLMSQLGDSSISQHEKGSEDRIEYNSNIKEGMPWVKRVDPRDIVFPWNAMSGDDCQWVAHRMIRHIDDIKGDSKLKNTKDLTVNIKLDKIEKTDMVELWEIHDYKTGKMYIIATGYNKFLFDEMDATQVHGLPFVTFSFNDIGKSIWGIPDSAILMPQLNEMTEIRTQSAQFRRMARVKLLIEENSIDKIEMKKLFDDAPVAFIEVKGKPNQVVKEFTMNIPTDLHQWGEVVRADSRELFGFSRIQLGELESTGRKTAYEIAKTSSGSESRTGERADVVSDTLKKLIVKIIGILFRFWDEDRIIQLTGVTGPEWVDYKMSDMKGDYKISVNIEEGTPFSSIQRKNNIMQVYQTFSNDPSIPEDSKQQMKQLLVEQFPYLDTSNWKTSSPPSTQPIQGIPQQGGTNGTLSDILQKM